MSLLDCRHCHLPGHWADTCPLLVAAESRKEHMDRITEFARRFTEGEIGQAEKQRMIRKENELWKAKQKEMAK